MIPSTLNVVLEGEFWRDANGTVWGAGGFGDLYWQRYLAVFDRVVVVSRFAHGPPAPGAVETSDSRVAFRPLPFYRGFAAFASVLPHAWRHLRAAAAADGAFILRAPGGPCNIIGHLRSMADRPFAVELVGDPAGVSAALPLGRSRELLRHAWTASTRSITRRAAAVSYVTSQSLQSRYPARSGQPTFAISSVVLDAHDFAHAPRRFVRGTQPVRLLFVGALHQLYKGPDVFVEAVAQLTANGEPVEAVVVGDGAHRKALEALVTARGVAARVRFTGHLVREDLRRELDAADLFVLPSRTEGLPRALIEAMARGLPCLGSRVGGIVELLEARALQPVGDVSALVTAISELSRAPGVMHDMATRNLAVARTFASEELEPRRRAFYETVRRLA